jgi:hypothetical protein
VVDNLTGLLIGLVVGGAAAALGGAIAGWRGRRVRPGI